MARLLILAFKVVGLIPQRLAQGLFAIGAVVAWAMHGPQVRQLEANLARVRPRASRRQLRALSRRGMRSYMRYYCEVFQLHRMSAAQITARVRCEGFRHVAPYLDQDLALPIVLGHLANWDLAGAWASMRVAPVTAVAEHLKPEEVYQQFVKVRQDVGISVVPVDHNGSEVFRELLRMVGPKGRRVVPLLADRDLSSSGVEVSLFGEAARVAPGPAALALSSGMPLIPTMMRYERLSGARRRAAGTKWGMLVVFHPPVAVPGPGPQRQRVAQMSQAWVDVLADAIDTAPEDWHMMAKVFVADLDPAKDAAVRAQGQPGGEQGAAPPRAGQE